MAERFIRIAAAWPLVGVQPDIFARRVFLLAGLYGLVVLLPQYAMEAQGGVGFVPPLNHPAHFYGFLGVALAWQFAFLLIARDVHRYRLFMLPAVLEKVTFGASAWVLYHLERADGLVAAFAGIDLLLAALFLTAFLRLRP